MTGIETKTLFDGELSRQAMARTLDNLMKERQLSVLQAAKEADVCEQDIKDIKSFKASLDLSFDVLSKLGCDFKLWTSAEREPLCEQLRSEKKSFALNKGVFQASANRDDLGKAFAEIRAFLKLTQEQAVKELGVTYQSARVVEAATSNPSVGKIADHSNAMGYQAEIVFTKRLSHSFKVKADKVLTSQALAKIREAEGLKKAHVAQLLGVVPQSVYNIEKGESNTGIDKLERYANAVGYDLSVLFTPHIV